MASGTGLPLGRHSCCLWGEQRKHEASAGSEITVGAVDLCMLPERVLSQRNARTQCSRERGLSLNH